jgi:hypothetical protein
LLKDEDKEYPICCFLELAWSLVYTIQQILAGVISSGQSSNINIVSDRAVPIHFLLHDFIEQTPNIDGN